MRNLILASMAILAVMGIHPKAKAQAPNYVIALDGSSDYIDLGTTVANNIRTIEFWFKPNMDVSPSLNITGYSFIVRNDGSQLSEFGFYIRGTNWPSGRGYLYFFTRESGVLHEIRSDTSYWDAGKWHHVCGTIDASAGMKLYIDGSLQGQTDPTGTAAIISSGNTTRIGTWGSAGIRYFNGQVDEFRFWSRALSQDEIQARMCYWLIPANEVGLLDYWKMNEGGGSVVMDAGVGTHNGLNYGGSYVQEDMCFIGTLGVEEHMDRQVMSISPNPLSERTTLSTTVYMKDAVLTVEDCYGRIVLQRGGITGRTVELDRGHLSGGMYFARLTQGGRIMATGKIVVADR